MSQPTTKRLTCPYDGCSFDGLTVLPEGAAVVETMPSQNGQPADFDGVVEGYCTEHTYYVYYRREAE